MRMSVSGNGSHRGCGFGETGLDPLCSQGPRVSTVCARGCSQGSCGPVGGVTAPRASGKREEHLGPSETVQPGTKEATRVPFTGQEDTAGEGGSWKTASSSWAPGVSLGGPLDTFQMSESQKNVTFLPGGDHTSPFSHAANVTGQVAEGGASKRLSRGRAGTATLWKVAPPCPAPEET